MSENGKSAEKEVVVRLTSSHTPPQGYETLGRMFAVIVPESLKLGDKVGATFEVAIQDAAEKILKAQLPNLTMLVRSGKDHWIRITADTAETAKAPKAERSVNRAGKMADVLKAGFSIDKLYLRIVELKGSKAKDGHEIDGQEAIVIAGAEQKIPTEMLYSFGLVRKVEAVAKAAKATTAKAKAATK